MLCQSFRVDEDSPVCPGSLFLSAAEEAPHETVERHIRGILGVLGRTVSRGVYAGISNNQTKFGAPQISS